MGKGTAGIVVAEASKKTEKLDVLLPDPPPQPPNPDLGTIPHF